MNFFRRNDTVNTILAKFISFISVLAAIVLLFFISSTTPVTAGPLGILVVFVCIYVVALGTVTFSLWGLNKVIVRLLKPFTVRRPMQVMSLQRAYYFSSILALAPVMLIGMQSVSVVGTYEVGLIGLFVIIGCIYIAKRTA